MMRRFILVFLISIIGALACQRDGTQLTDAELKAKARNLARDFILVDTHIDLPYRLQHEREDISVRTESGDFDYPRAKAGGLDAPFMSIYIAPEHEAQGDAKVVADSLIDLVKGLVTAWPDKFALARSVAEVKARRLFP